MSYSPKKCSFCSRPISLGQGVMYVRNDAATFWYCSTKCRKNSFYLKRDPRKLKWARARQNRPGLAQKNPEASKEQRKGSKTG